MSDPHELARLRAEVDRIDLRLVDLLAARQRLVEAVAAVKGDPDRARDRRREETILAGVARAAVAAGLSPAIALPVWRRLLEVCVEHERRLLTPARGAEPGDACCGCRDG
jgi:isochorismate pyruvate lyase